MQNILNKTGTVIESWEDFFEPVVTPGGHVFNGKISRCPNQWYGAIVVLTYDDQPVEILIPGMPKLHYPYVGKTFELKFNRNCNYAINLKLDGTNIAFYKLFDEILFKTRMVPVAGANKFGDFGAMIRDRVDKGLLHDVIRAVEDTGYTICTELWGVGNLHLVEYSTPLTLTFIAAIRPDGTALNYDEFESLAQMYNLPIPEVLWHGSGAEIHDCYLDIKKQCEKKNVQAGKFIIEGGIVHGDGRMVKVKPDTIEELHMTGNRRVGDEFIDQAIMKVCENFGDGFVDQTHITQLLSEDFVEDRILKSVDAIEHRIKDFRYKLGIKTVVREQMKGMEFENIGDQMRHLSKFFEKKDMTTVFAVVKNGI